LALPTVLRPCANHGFQGAELAGLPRAEFIDELGRANVSAIQTSVDELRDEMKLVRDAGR
jgi:Uncharacterised protein family (UPF0175)